MAGRMFILANFVLQKEVSQFLPLLTSKQFGLVRKGVIIQGIRVTEGLQDSHRDPGVVSEIVIKQSGHKLPVSTLSEIL